MDRIVAVEGKAACPYCGKLVAVEHDFIVDHREPESIGHMLWLWYLYGSGIYAPPLLGKPVPK